jgi:protein-tyrosine kinase
MSLIENALRKLQGARTLADSAPRPTGVVPPPGRSSIPAARQKKVTVEGPKHHVVEADLVRAGLLAPLDQAIPVADEFRRIKRPLIVNAFSPVPNKDGCNNVIMITSPLPRAGKTFCTVNLAVSMSLERELNVLLVDADVAKPHITREFGLSDRPGLIDLLLDEGRDINGLLVRTDLNDIQVLPAGRSHPQATELLASGRMSALAAELSTRYSDRIILLDSPPLLITSEAQALARHVGQIVLIVEAGVTTHHDLSHTLETLAPGKAVNVVLNKASTWAWSRGGDYAGEYSGYYGFDAERSDSGN